MGGYTEIKSLSANALAEVIIRECMNLTRNCYNPHTAEYADKIISNHFDIDN